VFLCANKKYNFKLIPQVDKFNDKTTQLDTAFDMNFPKYNLSQEEINKRIRIGLAISDLLHGEPIETIQYVCEDRDNQALGWL
jgi:hypothetical protein